MLPEGYVPIVVADTRRALQWVRGLSRRGLDAVRVEARGEAADKGDWQIGVAARHAVEARAFVGEVLRGDAELPAVPMLSRTGFRALLGIGIFLALLFGFGWLAGR